MIPDIMKLINRFVGQHEFMSLDAYENLMLEFNMIYSPEVMELLRQPHTMQLN